MRVKSVTLRNAQHVDWIHFGRNVEQGEPTYTRYEHLVGFGGRFALRVFGSVDPAHYEVRVSQPGPSSRAPKGSLLVAVRDAEHHRLPTASWFPGDDVLAALGEVDFSAALGPQWPGLRYWTYNALDGAIYKGYTGLQIISVKPLAYAQKEMLVPGYGPVLAFANAATHAIEVPYPAWHRRAVWNVHTRRLSFFGLPPLNYGELDAYCRESVNP